MACCVSWWFDVLVAIFLVVAARFHCVYFAYGRGGIACGHGEFGDRDSGE